VNKCVKPLGQGFFSLFASPFFDEFVGSQLLTDGFRYSTIKVPEVITRLRHTYTNIHGIFKVARKNYFFFGRTNLLSSTEPQTAYFASLV